jgi:S1-C subfamily serine protease
VAVLATGCVEAPDAAAFADSDDLPRVATPTAVTEVPTVDAILPARVRARSVERRAREMTVRIRGTGCGALGTGSGFAIGGGIIVTNRHVIEDATTISLNTWDGASLDASVEGVDYTDDLALVRIDRELPSAGRLATEDPVTGADVTVIGYPLGGQQELTSGRVVDYARLETDEGPRVVRLSTEIWPGNSGGPVLDDDGRVVGVVFAIERATDYALAVPISHLRDVLDNGTAREDMRGCES